jgi:hypothetical protein
LKKKGKTIYYEDIYPSRLEVATGDLWVMAPWVKVKKPMWNMRVMVFAWWSPSERIVAMGHQSLQ